MYAVETRPKAFRIIGASQVEILQAFHSMHIPGLCKDFQGWDESVDKKETLQVSHNWG